MHSLYKLHGLFVNFPVVIRVNSCLQFRPLNFNITVVYITVTDMVHCSHVVCVRYQNICQKPVCLVLI